MHKIGCADMGVKCEFKTEGEERDQVRDVFLKHAMENHSDIMEKMSEEEKKDMMKKVDEVIG
jgi:predicted small metal-binding protein